MEPELYPSIGDIEKIGVEYDLTTPADLLAYSIYSYTLPVGEAVSIKVRISKKSPTAGDHIANFEFSNIFLNDGGIMRNREESYTVFQRNNSQTLAFFQVTGNVIDIMCKNGTALVTDWKAIVAIISV